jgi:hypothetical protein
MMRGESVSLLSSTICAVNKLAVVQSSLTLRCLCFCSARIGCQVGVGPSARSVKRLFQTVAFVLALTLKAASTAILAGATQSALLFLASTSLGQARSALEDFVRDYTWLTQLEVFYLVVQPRLQRTFPLRPTRKQRIRAPRKKRSFRQWTNSRPNGKRWPTRGKDGRRGEKMADEESPASKKADRVHTLRVQAYGEHNSKLDFAIYHLPQS